MKRHWLGLALLAGGGLSLLLALWPGAARFDLVGMLKELSLTNDQIAQSNQRILVTLEAIEGRARSVDRMAEQLGQLELQVNSQRDQLARLELITAEQAALGKQLATLASSVGPRATHMAQVAKEEVALVQGLQVQTGALSAPLRRIRTSNESLYRKLQEAELRSGRILDAMPL